MSPKIEIGDCLSDLGLSDESKDMLSDIVFKLRMIYCLLGDVEMVWCLDRVRVDFGLEEVVD